MFLLDTNVVSELRKARAGRADAGVVEWARSAPPALLFLSVISVHELEHGVLLVERRDPRQGALLRTWLDDHVLTAFPDRVLPVTVEVARTAAMLHVPDPAPFRDALIAATAISAGMTVVTRNVSDFARFPDLPVVDPWAPEERGPGG